MTNITYSRQELFLYSTPANILLFTWAFVTVGVFKHNIKVGFTLRKQFIVLLTKGGCLLSYK